MKTESSLIDFPEQSPQLRGLFFYMNKISIFLFFFLFVFCGSSYSQYYPSGVSMNDGYLPNLNEPDKWIISLDGMFEWDREDTQTTQTSFQTSHANFNLFYGGQKLRGGVQVVHDLSRDIKDLSVGVGLAYNRPLFIEVGAGFLNRVLSSSSTDGWSYNVKVGYYYNWIMHVKYRVRVRLSLMYNYKKLNDVGDPTVTNFYPFIGFEFET